MATKNAQTGWIRYCIKEAGKDVRNALSGLKSTFHEEHNFRIEAVAALLIIAAAVYFSLTPVESAIIVGVIALVISLEIINSAIERILNLFCSGPEQNVGRIKDMAAGAVLISVLASVVMGLLIFWPHILEKLQG